MSAHADGWWHASAAAVVRSRELVVRGAGFVDAVMKATNGKGVKLLVNNVGGGVFEDGMKSLAYKGRLATVGYVDGVLQLELPKKASSAAHKIAIQ